MLAAAALAIAAAGIGFSVGQAQPQPPPRPEFHGAIEHLKAARGALDSQSWPDIGGHRAKAVLFIERALDETRYAMQAAG
jgi:hypothetical protein